MMATVHQQRDVTGTIRSLSTLPSHDYVDVFTVTPTTTEERSAEQWARAAVDHAAGPAGQFVWRVLLGLRLERRPSPDHVAGWRIVRRSDRDVVLEAASWCLTAQIALRIEEGQVTFATFIRYDRPVAELLWTPLSAGHRRAMPGLLRRAAKHVQASRFAEVST